MSTTNILDMNNRIEELEKNSGGGGTADSAKRSDIATEFNTTTAYTAGCYVYHEGKLYQFNTDHAAGDWDPTDVVEANVTDQIVSNKSAIDGLTASDVAYDNTDSELTATDVQGAVDELADKFGDQTIGTATDISSYDASNKYTFPSDGYVELKATSSGAYVVANINDMTVIARSGYSDYIIIYVRKGMTFNKTSSYTGTYLCNFYPLN